MEDSCLQSWAARDQIGQHLNLIIENLNANVQGLLNQGSDDGESTETISGFPHFDRPVSIKIVSSSGWLDGRAVGIHECLLSDPSRVPSSDEY